MIGVFKNQKKNTLLKQRTKIASKQSRQSTRLKVFVFKTKLRWDCIVKGYVEKYTGMVRIECIKNIKKKEKVRNTAIFVFKSYYSF